MLDGMTEQLVRITIDGKAIEVAPANTVIQALALSGEPLSENVGCMGQGVCGSCRCMVRRLGSPEVKTELACAKPWLKRACRSASSTISRHAARMSIKSRTCRTAGMSVLN